MREMHAIKGCGNADAPSHVPSMIYSAPADPAGFGYAATVPPSEHVTSTSKLKANRDVSVTDIQAPRVGRVLAKSSTTTGK